MNRLTWYIARHVTAGVLMALLMLVALNIVFQFIDETSDVEGGYTLWLAFVYVLLQAPSLAYEAFPVATLVGALVALGGLATRSELTAMRGAGMSLAAIARSVVLTGVALALLVGVLGEWVAPASARLGQNLRARSLSGGAVGAGDDGVWLRDQEHYIHVARVLAQGRVEGVRVYGIADGQLRRVVTAKEGRYVDGGWRLTGVEMTRIGSKGVRVIRPEYWRLDTELKPGLLDLLALPPTMLPLTELYSYIGYLERNESQASRYRLAFWVKLATPLATLVMLLLTVPLVFAGHRRAGAGQQIVIGVLIGVAFMLLNRLLNNAGLIYGLPPSLSALAPSLLFLVIALMGLRAVR